MEIITIDQRLQPAFASLLPEEIAAQLAEQPAVLAFGAVEDRQACGTLVFALEDACIRLLWLCTSEQARGKGVARALVRTLRRQARKDAAAGRLVADVRRGAPLDPVFTLLLSEGWLPVPFVMPSYSFTLAQLTKQPFWHQEMDTSCVVPLASLSKSVLREYSKRLDEQPGGAAVPLPLDPADYDTGLSLGYVQDGRLCAVVLTVCEGDALEIRYVHALPQARTAFARLIYAVGACALALYAPYTRVSLAAQEPKAQRLAERLLPGYGAQPMYRMICKLPATVKEENAHV